MVDTSAPHVVSIDGSVGEGGGQVLRCALSLAWLVGRPLHFHSIRAGRPKPGLANQHVAAVGAVARLTGLALSGNAPRSTELVATPAGGAAPPLPPQLVVEAPTAGACTLMLQAALPPLLFLAPIGTELVLAGGTHVPFAPPASHTQRVLAPLLERHMGVALSVRTTRRAFAPHVGELLATARVGADDGGGGGRGGGGGGDLRPRRAIRPLTLTDRGRLRSVTIVCEASEGGGEVARRMGARLEALLRASAALGECEEWDVQVEAESGAPSAPSAPPSDGRPSDGRPSEGKGGGRAGPRVQLSVQLVAATDTGCLLSANALCSCRQADHGQAVAREASALVAALEALLATGASACEHTCDQLVVFMALAEGTSRLRVPSPAARTSQHLPTVMLLAEKLTGAAFRLGPDEGGSQVIECDGVGARTRAPACQG